jgi:histidinol-phosphate phosphatase family protein
MLLSEAGGYLDRIYFCPHHPHSGYEGEIAELKIECDCRKPGTAMIDAAVQDLNIDRHQSWMVGDSQADMLAANRAGLLAIRVRTGETYEAGAAVGCADVEVQDFSAAVDLILEDYHRATDE